MQEHTDLIASIRAGKPLNELKQVAESTLTAIMGREAAYTGQELTWDEVLKAELDLHAAAGDVRSAAGAANPDAGRHEAQSEVERGRQADRLSARAEYEARAARPAALRLGCSASGSWILETNVCVTPAAHSRMRNSQSGHQICNARPALQHVNPHVFRDFTRSRGCKGGGGHFEHGIPELRLQRNLGAHYRAAGYAIRSGDAAAAGRARRARRRRARARDADASGPRRCRRSSARLSAAADAELQRVREDAHAAIDAARADLDAAHVERREAVQRAGAGRGGSRDPAQRAADGAVARRVRRAGSEHHRRSARGGRRRPAANRIRAQARAPGEGERGSRSRGRARGDRTAARGDRAAPRTGGAAVGRPCRPACRDEQRTGPGARRLPAAR